MKNWKWKKILSIVLAALLVVALLPNTVNASETGVSDETTQIRTITLDDDGNIIASSDGTVTDDQTAAIADTDQSDTNTQTDQTDDEQTNQDNTSLTDTGSDQTDSDTSTGSGEESASDGSDAGEDEDGSGSGEVTSSDTTQDSSDESNSGTAVEANAGEEVSASDSGNASSADDTQNDVDSNSESETSGDDVESTDNSRADFDTDSDSAADDGETSDSSTQSGTSDDTIIIEGTYTTNPMTSTPVGVSVDTSDTDTVNEAVAAVEALIEALPTVDELESMTSDELSEAYDQVYEASKAYDALSEEEKSLVNEESLTILSELFAFFNTLTETVDVGDKTLTVDANATDFGNGVYTTIQDAIDYIYALDNSIDVDLKKSWTIFVASGTYDQFAVLPGLDGLTVKAADNAEVTVKTWSGADNASARALYPSGGEFKDSFNSILIAANNVTIEGLNIVVGDTGIKADGSETETAPWYSAGITDLGNNYIPSYRSEYDGLTIQSCTFTTTVGACSGVLLASAENWTVSGCTFDGFDIAVYALGDNSVAENVSITNNTFNNCEQAAYIYYGGKPAEDAEYSLTFTGNTLNGTADQYCMVTFVDLYGNNGSIDNLTVTDNTLKYSVIGLIDVNGNDMNILETNICDAYSFYVYSEDETGTTDTNGKEFTFTYVSSGEGYWTLNSDSFSSVKNLTDKTSVESSILEVIYAANIGDSVNTVSVTVTMTSYAKTFLEPNAIEWNPGSLPEVSKKIVTTTTEGDGSETKPESTQADAAAGDTVSYKLTSVVPSTLSSYIDYDNASTEEEESTDDDVTEQIDEESTIFVPMGTVQTVTTTNEDGTESTINKVYAFSFVDEMDSNLVPDVNSVVVLIGNERLDAYYTVAVTESTIDTTKTDDSGNVITKNIYVLTVTIDLLKLYAGGIITEDDFNKTEITVTYNATLSENATAGSYSNIAYVTFPEGYSKESGTEVNTYSLRIYKYDLGTFSTEGVADTVPNGDNSEPLANAVFYLCNEDGEKVSTALVTDSNGIAEFTATGLSGTYYLVEIATPTGYVSVAENATTVITISGENVDENGVYTVEVANAAIPQTGGMGTQPFTVAGIAILLLAGLAYVVTRRRVY